MTDDNARDGSSRGADSASAFASANGPFLMDASGRSYIDFSSGRGTLNHGHNHPDAKKAVLDFIHCNGVQYAGAVANTAHAQFVDQFQAAILNPRRLDYVVESVGSTGSCAIESAVCRSREIQQRSHIVVFGAPRSRFARGREGAANVAPVLESGLWRDPDVTFLPFDGYVEGLDSAALFQKNIEGPCSTLPLPAAVLLETVSSDAGVRVASKGWLHQIAEICKALDILLIVDDTRVGSGRTGRYFSFEHFGLQPDMVCVANSVGGGLPLALLLTHAALQQADDGSRRASAASPGSTGGKGLGAGKDGGMNIGHPLALVSGRALLAQWQDSRFRRQLEKSSEVLGDRLHDLASQFDCQASGCGMLWAVDFGDPVIATDVVASALRRGLVLDGSESHLGLVRLLPPLNIPPKQLHEGIAIFRRIVGTTCSEASRAKRELPVEVDSIFEMFTPEY